MVDTGHNIKWDHFEILERGKTNKHCLNTAVCFIFLVSNMPLRKVGIKTRGNRQSQGCSCLIQSDNCSRIIFSKFQAVKSCGMN